MMTLRLEHLKANSRSKSQQAELRFEPRQHSSRVHALNLKVIQCHLSLLMSQGNLSCYSVEGRLEKHRLEIERLEDLVIMLVIIKAKNGDRQLQPQQGGREGAGREIARKEVSLIDLKKTTTVLSFLMHSVSIVFCYYLTGLVFGFKVLYYQTLVVHSCVQQILIEPFSICTRVYFQVNAGPSPFGHQILTASQSSSHSYLQVILWPTLGIQTWEHSK